LEKIEKKTQDLLKKSLKELENGLKDYAEIDEAYLKQYQTLMTVPKILLNQENQNLLESVKRSIDYVQTTKNLITKNKENLKELEITREGQKDLKAVLKEGLNALGYSYSEEEKSLLYANNFIINPKDQTFKIIPQTIQIGLSRFQRPIFQKLFSERFERDANQENLFLGLEFNQFRQIKKIKDLKEFFDKEDLSDFSQKAYVRFYKGKKISEFWQIDKQADVRTQLIANLKVNNKLEWIRIDDKGKITDQEGNHIKQNQLHPNDLYAITEKLKIDLVD